MDSYLRIARVYTRGTAAAVWLFLFICLLAISANGEIAGRRNVGILGGVLSRKSYLAMFAYFNACVLGVLLRDNIAHPWASVLPHYRKKHLQVAALMALFFLAIPMFSMMFVGTSDIATTSVAVIFLTCLAAGLWQLHHPSTSFLAAIFLIFVFAPATDPYLAPFLAGTTPFASAALVFVSLVALWAVTWRLLALNEDTAAEYYVARLWGDFLRGRGQLGNAWAQGSTLRAFKQTSARTIEESLPASPADERAAIQNFGPLNSPFTNLKQLDELFGYSDRSLWQRLQLWRLGTQSLRTSMDVGLLMVMTLLMIPLMSPGRDTVVIFSVQVMTNPFIRTWPSWSKRRHRLGYESLRPRTRREFVREVGLALLWDIIQCWFGGVLCMGIGAAIWAPELLQFKNLILFISCTGVGQLCAYAMGIWSLRRGMIASVACATCAFMVTTCWMLWTTSGGIGIEVDLAIASVLAAVSVATIALGYRHWCRADLD